MPPLSALRPDSVDEKKVWPQHGAPPNEYRRDCGSQHVSNNLDSRRRKETSDVSGWGVNGDAYALTGEENVGQKEVRFEMRHEDDDREEMILSQ